MPSVGQAVLRSWTIPPAASFALAITAAMYLRGWWLLRRAGVPFVPLWRACAFFSGLLTLWVALASPLDTFSGFVLTAHMLQHMLLMMVAPPLILMGAPLIPLLRGMPVFAAREFAGPFLNWRVAQKFGHTLTQPVVALLLMGTMMLGWHVPRLYELALTSSSWHEFEHACFFLTSLIFWWPVVRPWPSVAQWPRWSMVPYLIIADLQNTVLSAILVFSDRVLYRSYATGPRLFGFSVLGDQAAAGAIMWVVGSIAFVVPAVIIAVHCLSRKTTPATQPRPDQHALHSEYAPAGAQHTSLLRLPLPLRMKRRTFEAISFLICFGLVSLGFLWLLSSTGNDDDDLALRFSQQTGPFVVSVFAPRGELHSGPTAFAILVQSSASHAVLLDTTIRVTVTSLDRSAPPLAQVTASRDHSANKLLASAELNLPGAGEWTLRTFAARDPVTAEVSFPFHVAAADSDSGISWVMFPVPAFTLVLLVSYLWRHRHSKPTTAARDAISQA